MTERRYRTPQASDLHALANRGGPVLSLFVPVTASIPDAAQNAVRHARVVRVGLARWCELRGDEGEVVKAETSLADFAGESASPAASVASRAAFWSPDAGLRSFGLGVEVDEGAYVATTARLRPILRAAERPNHYRVLALSAKRVALFEGDEDGLEPVSVEALPASLEDALGGELTEPSLQHHSGQSSGAHPVYHGQGGAPRGRRVDLDRFHQRVARALESEIADDVVPLVLAGDAQHRTGLVRGLSRDVGLISEGLEGNADHRSMASLHAATWPLVARSGEGARQALERVREGGARLVTQLSEIVAQAVMGRIRRLWVPEAGCIPGRIDSTQGRAAEAWGDDDLIDGLVVEVLRRGGSVRVLDGTKFAANGEHLAAELR